MEWKGYVGGVLDLLFFGTMGFVGVYGLDHIGLA
jgi:hypothetical protein